MSRLLGPLSETISSVSARPCARAGEKIAGADTVPAASAVMDLRKSRRFMPSPLLSVRLCFAGDSAKLMPIGPIAKALESRTVLKSPQTPHRRGPARLHTNGHLCRKIRRRRSGQKTTGRQEAGPLLHPQSRYSAGTETACSIGGSANAAAGARLNA